MGKYDLRERTYKFGLRIVLLVDKFPKSTSGNVIGKQLIRSGTSVGANSEEADGASTKKDFIHKIYIAKREASETRYWLRIVLDAEILNNENNKIEIKSLMSECEELIKILSSISHNSKKKLELIG